MSNIFSKIFFEKRTLVRLVIFLIADVLLIILSVFLAFLVRFEGEISSYYFLNIKGIIFLSLLITLPIFYFLKLYHFTWAYVSAEELVSLIKGVALSFLILTATFFVLKNHPIFSDFPRSTLFITYFFIFVLCGGLRFAKRIYLQFFPLGKKGEKERTLIVGAGDAGEQILRSILTFNSGPYLPIGLADDSPAKQGALIHGLKVLGRIKDIPKIVRENKVEGLIIALPSVGSQIIQEAVEKGREAGLRKIKIIPPIEEVIAGKITIGQLRQVEMEDLLGRGSLSLDQKLIENFIQNKTVLVTGAAGSIGSELCRQIAKFNPLSLMLLDQDETGIFNISEELADKFPKIKKVTLVADIGDEEKVGRIFKEFRPNIVFHAAAYKHVPLMEENLDEAVKNNIFGTKIVAEAALRSGVEKLVFISTDKSVNPTSVMGATKRAGEMICQILNQKNSTKFISVRFGNVLDSRGSVIPIFREKIKKREPIEVTHPEMQRYFMVTSEACLLVMQAGAMGQGGEVFVLDMGDPIKILDLAREMIRLSGLEPDKDIPIVFTEPRPGEKLFEEILTAEEGTIATQNQKIFMAKLSGVNQEKLNLGLAELKKAVEKGNKETIIKTLKEIIPFYGQQK
ncbi:MAG: nucleoside-diphosphate sugar epimerase/dehydratase [bacterium]|nr:nucleoside-diphosphate sugar epimerase/dehydratase [bacterium]